MLEKQIAESGIEISRICNFLKCSEENVLEMYQAKSLDTEILLRWIKLLEYDFFRLYSQHLILYAPTSATSNKNKQKTSDKTSLPQFRKNIYTKEVIDFILELLKTGEMTKMEVIERYKVPKTTLYKWISKHRNSKN